MKDNEIYKALLEGNIEEAFEKLFKKYKNKMYTYAYYILGDGEDAYDVVANIFMNVYNRLLTGRFEGSLKAYMFKSLKNEILKMITYKQKDQKLKKQLMEKLKLNNNDKNKLFEKVLMHLTEREKILCILKFKEELTYAEISSIMGLSEKTLRNMMVHIVKKLKNIFLKRGDVHEK